MSLQSLLAQHLPKSESFKYLYIQSKPTYIKSPINFPKNHKLNGSSIQERPDTIKIRHFFTLIDNDVIVLGIEVFVYILIYKQQDFIDQFIFVSKCDTTGLKKLNGYRVSGIVELVLLYIVNYDIRRYRIKVRQNKHQQEEHQEEEEKHKVKQGNGYVNETVALIDKLQTKLSTNPNHYNILPYYGSNNFTDSTDSPPRNKFRNLTHKINTHICLFTKTAPQYMFPNSSKNKYKHLGNGQVLLSWWLKIIELICRSNSYTNDGDWSLKKLIIPGSDTFAMRKFIEKLPDWSIGHIFGSTNKRGSTIEKEEHKQDLAVYNIPLFPDDPKGRFLEHLIVENRYFNVDIDRFYQELGYRQEFRLGDCVGLIGCTKFGKDTTETTERNNDTTTSDNDDLDAVVVSIHQYKQFINNVIKLINFDKLIDVEYLVQVQIPSYFENNVKEMKEFKYGEVVGLKENSAVKGAGEKRGVDQSAVDGSNGSGGGMKRTNDLTGLIKRKKR